LPGALRARFRRFCRSLLFRLAGGPPLEHRLLALSLQFLLGLLLGHERGAGRFVRLFRRTLGPLPDRRGDDSIQPGQGHDDLLLMIQIPQVALADAPDFIAGYLVADLARAPGDHLALGILKALPRDPQQGFQPQPDHPRGQPIGHFRRQIALILR
jgi:hypothetical protein